jgi:arsenite/tail-anchored protein-transporting ATPase
MVRPVRIVLVTGKGGVGKTTLAAATALAAAARGSRTLLVSTDAAHSLSDVLQCPVDMEPTGIAPNLEGLQIDARHELARSWGTIAAYMRRLLGVAEVDRLRLDELVVIPGLDQLVALARLHTLATEGPWEAMVVDCAPSADSLRLLTLPDVLQWYVNRLFGRNGAVARLGRRRLERSLDIPMPGDPVIDSIHELSGQLSQLREVLDEASTTARIVVTPERVVIAEAQRTLAYLALYGYAVDAVLVNRVADPAIRSDGQVAQLEAIAEGFACLPRLTVRQRSVEPVGAEALADIGRELYGESDPVAHLSFTPPLQIVAVGDEWTVRLFTPGARREDIDLELDADELIVTLGSHRRTVKLPDGLSGRPVNRAGLRDQHLEVVFGEVAGAG